MTLTTTNLDGILPLVARGKVRDIYEVDAQTLLFVATDRISAYDVIMQNGIPDKGKILTRLLEFWFSFLLGMPNHLVLPHATDEALFARLPAALSQPQYRLQLLGRALLVRKLRLIPLEVIVRGYITGLAWKEYRQHGTVHTLAVDGALEELQQLPTPLFTPLTKADQGEHDENISPQQAAQLVGQALCDRVSAAAVELYTRARDYARQRGIIIADTKFEFGLDDADNLVLVDEVLTPDSLRFWSAAAYKVGAAQDLYDKQYLRDWLTLSGLAGQDGVAMTDEVVHKTRAKYIEAYEALTGSTWVA